MPVITVPARENAAPNWELPMALCAGMYWAAMLLDNFDVGLESGESYAVIDPLFLTFHLALVAMMLLATCLAWKFAAARLHKALAWTSVAGSAVSLLAMLPALASLDLPSAVTMGVYVVEGIRTACYILFWGLNFTALNKHEAERTTLASLGVAFALYLACSLVLRTSTAVMVAMNVMMVASLVPFLLGRYRIDVVRRPDATPSARILVPFYATRVFFGVCLGVVLGLCVGLDAGTDGRAVAISLVAVAALCALFALQRRAPESTLASLRLAPLLACGAIVCPFLAAADLLCAFCSRAPSIIWLCWIVLHSVQISSIKEEAGLDDALLSFSEKIVFMAFAVLAAVATSCLPGFVEAIAADPHALEVAFCVVVFLVLVVCTYQLNRVIDGKQTERIVDAAFELTEQSLEPIYGQLAERYGLTAREKDVFRLLAKGYARPTICEELFISESTERSHVYHIYRKMDIHSRDELFAIIEEASREHVASSSVPRSRSGNTD